MQDIADGKKYGKLHNDKFGTIRYPIGHAGKKGYGFLHIVEQRMAKDGATLDKAIDTAIKVGDAAEIGTITASKMNTRWLDWNNTRAIIALTENGNPIITGYEIRADDESVAYPAAETSRNQPLARREEVVAARTDESTVAKQRAAELAPRPHVRSEEVIRALNAKLASTGDIISYIAQ